MLWVDGINARRAKKNKDKLQGLITATKSLILIHSFFQQILKKYQLYTQLCMVTNWNIAVNKIPIALAIKNMQVIQSSIGQMYL